MLFNGIECLKICDFGKAMDARIDCDEGFQLTFRTAKTDRGGAQAYLAPEILQPEPGRGVILDYAGNDAWSAGIESVC